MFLWEKRRRARLVIGLWRTLMPRLLCRVFRKCNGALCVSVVVNAHPKHTTGNWSTVYIWSTCQWHRKFAFISLIWCNYDWLFNDPKFGDFRHFSRSQPPARSKPRHQCVRIYVFWYKQGCGCCIFIRDFESFYSRQSELIKSIRARTAHHRWGECRLLLIISLVLSVNDL